MKSGRHGISIAVQVVALLLVAAISQPAWMWAATRGPELPDPGRVSVSREDQIQLGQKAVAEVYQQMPVLSDSNPTAQYIKQLGARLQAVIPQQYNWPYQFHVIQQKEVNAFAVPGGPLFVNVGTIEAADNEAQLAGVMAHEMAHVYMQHSIKGMQKEGMAQGLGALIGGILGSVIGGTAGALANMGARSVGGLMSMKYSRADEAQADAVGAIIMWKAGYNPLELARFFQKLEQEGGAGPQFLSDHPNPGNRYQALQTEVADWPQKNFNANTGGFQNAKASARNVKAYTAQQIQQMAQNHAIHNTDGPQGPYTAQNGQGRGPSMSGVPQSDIEPSGDFQTLQHNAFTIQYPSNWRPTGDPNSSVTIAPQAGVTQNAIAYGVILNGFQPQADSVDQAFDQLVAELKQGNPDLRTVGSPETIRVNGVQGKSVDLRGPSPVTSGGSQLEERDWLVGLPNSQGVLVYAVFVAPQKDFNSLRPTFERMLKSLHVK